MRTLQLWEASFIHKGKDLQSLKDQVWMISNWNWPDQKTSDVTIIFIKVWRTFARACSRKGSIGLLVSNTCKKPLS